MEMHQHLHGRIVPEQYVPYKLLKIKPSEAKLLVKFLVKLCSKWSKGTPRCIARFKMFLAKTLIFANIQSDDLNVLNKVGN